MDNRARAAVYRWLVLMELIEDGVASSDIGDPDVIVKVVRKICPSSWPCHQSYESSFDVMMHRLVSQLEATLGRLPDFTVRHDRLMTREGERPNDCAVAIWPYIFVYAICCKDRMHHLQSLAVMPGDLQDQLAELVVTVESRVGSKSHVENINLDSWQMPCADNVCSRTSIADVESGAFPTPSAGMSKAHQSRDVDLGRNQHPVLSSPICGTTLCQISEASSAHSAVKVESVMSSHDSESCSRPGHGSGLGPAISSSPDSNRGNARVADGGAGCHDNLSEQEIRVGHPKERLRGVPGHRNAVAGRTCGGRSVARAHVREDCKQQ